MNGATGPTRGCIRPRAGVAAGIALPSASRTSRRCTPNLRATPAIVPLPNSYSRRISSKSSTVTFLRRIWRSSSRCGSARRVRPTVAAMHYAHLFDSKSRKMRLDKRRWPRNSALWPRNSACWPLLLREASLRHIWADSSACPLGDLWVMHRLSGGGGHAT